MDSSTTHHFTPDYNVLEGATPFGGQEQVTVGNGKSLTISHIGHAKLPAMHSSSLTLKHILHTPAISHNLLSVVKLCRDNKAFVEFHPNSFFVKDQATRKVLL